MRTSFSTSALVDDDYNVRGQLVETGYFSTNGAAPNTSSGFDAAGWLNALTLDHGSNNAFAFACRTATSLSTDAPRFVNHCPQQCPQSSRMHMENTKQKENKF